jgi:NAD(P)-dependent dehydrogenase (short-subunit alcohol dehydrogenase family)
MAEAKVCIITGAGGAIGRATGGELSRLGYRVVLTGRTQATLRETQQLLAGESMVAVADVTQHAEVTKLVARVLEQFGRVDAVVNNAGSAPVAAIEQTTPEMWNQVIATNLSAAFYISRAVWPTFKSQKSGVVVNISSMAARDPFAGFLAYGAAKAALNNFGLTLAREGAPIGVRVHTIAPGAVETPMLRSILSPQQYPTENTLEPSEVARVVAQCVTGTELRYTSGEVIWLSKRP